MKNNRVFITGGCGFIGTNLVKYLLDKGGYEISIYDNLSTGSKKNLDRAISDSRQRGTVKFIEGDVLEKERLEKVAKGHTAIVHLAAHTNVIDSLKNPQANFNTNTIGTFNTLESARKNNIKSYIFASSNAVVGEQEPPIDEEKVPAPISPYGASKLAGEALCSAYYHSYGIRTVTLRFANCYGPYSEHKTSVVAKFIKRVKQYRSLVIYGDGNQTRDFIYAWDVCQAIGLSLNPFFSDICPQAQVFQIATGVETKILDLANMIRDLAIKSGLKAIKIVFRDTRKGEIRRNYSDINKAKKFLGFNPSVKFKDGLERIWNGEKPFN